MLERLRWIPNRLVLVAPAFDVHDAHRRVVQLAAGDFARSQPERAERLQALLARTRGLFDSDMQEALTIAADDPLLFRHYWQAESAFAAFAATTARPESQFNLNTFFQVVAGLSKHGCAYLRPSRPLDVETLILLGAADPVIDWPSVASAARTLFGHVEERTVANCGHWVHLERPDVFLKLVAKTSQRC